MPTHAEIAGRLLTEAAGFFRNLAEQNDPIKQEMTENAVAFERMAELVTSEPDTKAGEHAHSELAGKLLKDASTFFMTLAEQNEPLKEQMTENARIYDQIGDMVAQNPHGVIE